jgi:hypothetical protein
MMMTSCYNYYEKKKCYFSLFKTIFPFKLHLYRRNYVSLSRFLFFSLLNFLLPSGVDSFHIQKRIENVFVSFFVVDRAIPNCFQSDRGTRVVWKMERRRKRSSLPIHYSIPTPCSIYIECCNIDWKTKIDLWIYHWNTRKGIVVFSSSCLDKIWLDHFHTKKKMFGSKEKKSWLGFQLIVRPSGDSWFWISKPGTGTEWNQMNQKEDGGRAGR